MKVYLAGPINKCSDAEAKDWREEARTKLQALGHLCLDPMVRDYRGVEKSAFHEIVVGDKIDIANCDRVLVMALKPSWGTAMEVLYAHDHAKRPVAVVENADLASPWLRYHATLCESLDAAIYEITKRP